MSGGFRAAPQSGQNASFDASGYAGVASNPDPQEMHKFLGRLVGERLNGRVNNYPGLVQFAKTWADKAQQQNCEAARLTSVYDDMIEQLRRDAQSPGAWLTSSNSGMMSFVSGVRESPLAGNSAPLNEKGLAGVCATGKQTDVDLFVGRLILQLGFHCADPKTLQSHTSVWAQRVRQENCVAAKVKPIYDEIESRLKIDSRIPNSYVKDMKAPAAPLGGGSLGSPATPVSGQEATLNAPGFAGAVARGKAQDVEQFVGRLIYDLGCKIEKGMYPTVTQLAGQWASEVRQQNCIPERTTAIYNNMVARIRQDASVPGSWVTTSAKPASSLTSTPTPPLQSSPSYAPFGQAPPLAPMTPLGQPPRMAPVGAPQPYGNSGPPLPPPPLAPLR